MIGVSLPKGYLLNGEKIDMPREVLLPELYRRGVRSIEFRQANPQTDPEQLLKSANLLWNYRFRLTVHAKVLSQVTAVEDVFTPLRSLLRHLRQPSLTVVIHPTVEDNVTILQALADHAKEHNYPVVIALENNRRLPDGTEGDSTALVLDAVERADRPNVGICFDFGHYAYYVKKNHPDTPDMLPPPAFFKKVVHTHIHAMNGLRTHFPLDAFELPLKEYLSVQGHNYYGVHNIELDFPRFADLCDPVPALFGSVDALKEALPFYTHLYDAIRANYDRQFLSVLANLQGDQPGTRMGVIQSSSYLFNTNGFLWCLDPSFRNARKLASTPALLPQLFRDVKLIVITHGHADHFEKQTVQALSGSKDITWIIPDFLEETALSYGVPKEQMILSHKDEPIVFGPLTLLPFEGRHLRPVSRAGVPCYGYYITAENVPSFVCPGDVRDYSTEGLAQLPEADYCLAHVWLGDDHANDESFAPLDEAFSRFMLYFSRKNILLSHLYDAGRKETYMWRQRHGRILSEKIHEISPETETRILRIGDILDL